MPMPSHQIINDHYQDFKLNTSCYVLASNFKDQSLVKQIEENRCLKYN